MATSPARNIKWYENISNNIVNNIEHFFKRLGQIIGKYPKRTIIICVVLTLLSSLGFLRFYQEKNPMRLWVPANSQFLVDTDWLINTFQRAPRLEMIITEADDVLKPEILQELNVIYHKVSNAKTSNNITWTDICLKIPMVDPSISARFNKPKSQNEIDISFDPSIDLPSFIYCTMYESLRMGCFERNILELWKYDTEKLKAITKQDILDALNDITISPVSGHPMPFDKLLGGIVRNSTGHIISAKSILSVWIADVNFTLVDMSTAGNDLGTADWATDNILNWELEFMKILANETDKNVSKNFYVTGRSFSDVSGNTVLQDMPMLLIGGVFMMIYIQFAISKFNCIDVRTLLSLCGMLSVGLSIVTACGICALCGVFFGPVHTSLPFLIMGLGVDDMFVIAASWNFIAQDQKKIPLYEKIGLMLQHAGVSITVTSVTDFMAFLVGSFTILPSLSSFCIYAAVGVFTTFTYVVTFFVACFTLDQIRIDEYRNGIIPCITHTNYKRSEFSQTPTIRNGLKFFYDKFIFTTPGKIFVLLTTLALSGIGIQGTLEIKQKFDPIWFAPSHTHFHKFVQKRIQHYPLLGYEGSILTGKLNYTAEYPLMRYLETELYNHSDILDVSESWVTPFQKYVLKNFKKDINEETLSEEEWNSHLSTFLFSPSGGKYQANFKFKRDLKCGEPAPQILVSTLNFNFLFMDGPDKYLPAMKEVYKIANNANVTTGDKYVTAWAKVFASWMTDDVIDVELTRNLLLALVCVMFCTILLIANLQICLWIFVCVLLTVVSVCGWMQKWGLTIDIVSCICLTLAIGLCVDYAAHIGYTFITISGESRRDRALKTVLAIGTAVLHGGFSTLLAMTMLAFSEAYTFQAFFKIFLLVVLFGQFYGIIFLPVILSLVGPKSRQTHEVIQQVEMT